MVSVNFFSKGVSIKRITEDELVDARANLEMERSRSRQSLQRIEEQKQQTWAKAIEEVTIDLRRSYLGEISNLGFKTKLEKFQLQTIDGQIRLVSVVEAIKDFQRRQIQSPLLKKLVNVRLSDLDSNVRDIVRQGFTGDHVTDEIIRRWTAYAPGASTEVTDLENIIERVQADVDPSASVAERAEKARQQHNDQLDNQALTA